MPQHEKVKPDPSINGRRVTPPRLGPPEEINVQLELHGTEEREWLANRGWSGPKVEEIIRLRCQARADELAELSHRKGIRRTTRLSMRSDVKSLLMGSPQQLQNQQITLNFQGDFKRARIEISELLAQIGVLEGVPYPNWALKQRVESSPEVDDLAEEIAEMVVDDVNKCSSEMEGSV
ncbi:hypothetical protein V5O48_017446 [Marasmius crinis-equi]|uniref:Uncharacterized protein n=1 Tax=Marasmius crinis-equi TaxID=585013 RepID=A0ABR3ENX6_9AGAR